MYHSTLILMPIILVVSIMNIILNRQHLLLSLLSLEVMILALVALMSTLMLVTSSLEMLCILVLLTMGACEASLGLACLVLMTRTTGNDHLTSLTTMKC